ncbi:MAG: PASTA domain-containing protein [Spirochaetes bacterium]|nr:PASTA domain-containing protein [Spirochaetota bacterium]
MSFFLEFLTNIKERIFISSKDTEVIKAKKIIWYAFFGAIIMIFIVSYFLFVTLTFQANHVKVPHINGDNVYVALNKLADKNLVANVTPRYSEEFEEGMVFEQKEGQGSIVKKGRTISFFVSLGQPQTSLPDYSGYSLFQLVEALDKKYVNAELPFIINAPIYEFNERLEKGKIIRQSPEEGTPISKVKEISLWVSNGPKEEGKKILSSFVKQHLNEIMAELSDYEIFYTLNFTPVSRERNDLIITEQSIGEGALVDDIIKENKTLTLAVNKYVKKPEENEVSNVFIYDLPEKPIPYDFVVKVTDAEALEETLLAIQTKGNISLSIPYTAPKFSKIMVHIDDEKVKEEEVVAREVEATN